MNMNTGPESDCDVLKAFHANLTATEKTPHTIRIAIGWKYIITDILEPQGAASIRPWIWSCHAYRELIARSKLNE
jgi:hypothetical protein